MQSILRYDYSASDMKVNRIISLGMKREKDIWEQNSLPIGNGSLGISIYGDISERLIVNEKTLWRGGPSPNRPNYNGGNIVGVDGKGKSRKDYYDEINSLFKQGKDSEASQLCAKLVGEEDGYGGYQCWGEIDIDFGHKKVKKYSRKLDIDNAIANVEYVVGETEYQREYFVSHPDNVFAAKLTAKGKEKLDCRIAFPSMQGGTISAQGNAIVSKGKVEDNGLNFYAKLAVCQDGGVIDAEKDILHVYGSQSVIIFMSAGTDYANNFPTYRSGEDSEHLASRIDKIVDSAIVKGYDNIKKDHINDYRQIYDRVSLDLGGTLSKMPTNKLLKAYKRGLLRSEDKRCLEQLLFNYARYLMMGSSRENDVLPSNLQGIWNNRNSAPWQSDFHMNVNLQMNYWPVYNANMAECAIPLINYVDSLRAPGRITAEVYTGIKSEKGEQNGFVFHTQNTPFGWTCPGWDFSWGWSPAASAWILQNVYEYFEYTQDKKFLKEKIYPIMKESALYFEKALTESLDGKRLLTIPCFSPEHGPYTMGNTYEQALIWQLFKDCISASEALNCDHELATKWQKILARLNPIEVGEDGQIKEWYFEGKLGKIGQVHHRHMSHLLGLFPGDLINKNTPEWLAGAVVSMNDRGDKSTGWAICQRLNSWARVGDGERAYKLVGQLLKTGILNNLYDAHPPFQIDGNFGYASGVIEMLMQSNLGYIELLPTLPKEWQRGKVSGLVARGNFEIAMSWSDCKVDICEIVARSGGVCRLKYSGMNKDRICVVDKERNKVDFEINACGAVCFDTKKGEKYTITQA